MTAALIDGKAHAAKLKARLIEETARLKAEHGLVPGLATVLVGNDPASEVYVRNKNKTAEALGFKSVHHHLAETASEAEVLDLVRALNADPSVHGILVQMPLPKQIREQAVLDVLDPAKDVDALTPTNAGLLLSGRAKLVSCTPAGMMILLKETIGAVAGLEALVIGRSLLFGKPAALLLQAANATVTMAHSKTRDLAEVCRRADILVAAIGKPEFVRGDWVKPGATVIDVGINRVPAAEGKTKLVGDVAFAEAVERAGHITPVPGGVGAMTIICLMRNTLIAAAALAGLAVPSV
ncbi:bifunctional methylenetetrahydrofolate dehydrogenase/methenyltetrahydrofolate cyclohydrolase FolD [Rhizomicrobium electricum]|jgi:methylenetetrahydrofolate dehydrogenase (NADP+)/methenyltetrahydrofolate cyclohydrolase|uniref:Bifunctional protein FolD n=1 Tax=Rhizomicrobium electricum TaxID=480070 RepID=A0ABN1F3Y0_9PROT|nr:bifunctional methylenetetrahydrofolate dehydrogenase/methenyltetrahydrofolate cyclohydrolase FolD [Rhizomicrobium electricum]NIJ49269.1 methylenetetrahydrofolate dehydrogenase (NADP+)/methenyltetrahydrofolate cyclohydrolase [Rhizomicrobium electricum]